MSKKTFVCEVCNKKASGKITCSLCKAPVYCSGKCKKAHSTNHKDGCNANNANYNENVTKFIAIALSNLKFMHMIRAALFCHEPNQMLLISVFPGGEGEYVCCTSSFAYENEGESLYVSFLYDDGTGKFSDQSTNMYSISFQKYVCEASFKLCHKMGYLELDFDNFPEEGIKIYLNNKTCFEFEE